jgi:hypothetical protein
MELDVEVQTINIIHDCVGTIMVFENPLILIAIDLELFENSKRTPELFRRGILISYGVHELFGDSNIY